MEKITIGMFIILFIGVIVVLAMFPQISGDVHDMTTKQYVENESVDISDPVSGRVNMVINESTEYTITNYPEDWRTVNTACHITTFEFRNQTNVTMVNGTDYVFWADNGTFVLLDTPDMNTSEDNATYYDYTFCPEGYMTNSSSRTVANLILIFAALGLVSFAIYYGVRGYI